MQRLTSSLLRARSSFSTAAATTPSVAVLESTSAASTAPQSVVVTQSSSLWQKLLAFSAGLAVGGAYYAFTLQDTWRSDDGLERSVSALRKETAKTTVEFRERVALLEHEVTSLKREMASWGHPGSSGGKA